MYCFPFLDQRVVIARGIRILSLKFHRLHAYMFMSFSPFFKECKNYQILSSADRKVTHGSSPRLCDNNLGPGWFRFLGAAGMKMPTWCIPAGRCGTHIPGWLNGTHPEEYEGNVTRQACFHCETSCCRYFHDIQVRNCSGYYVYYLRKTICHARYCGTLLIGE